MGRKKAARALATGAAASSREAFAENNVPPRMHRKKAERLASKAAHQQKEKRLKAGQPKAEGWATSPPKYLVARLETPKTKSKYYSYFEFTENKDKKKKLEFQTTTASRPPPGFRFVAIGDPRLTNACKEISRECGAMIFIVSGASNSSNLQPSVRITSEVYRTGYFFREAVVEEAMRFVGASSTTTVPIAPEPIPESQEEINRQADAAIRDLFPRIPNDSREAVIQHSFQKVQAGDPKVGLQPDLHLSRRAQLAVLAHIRHVHTRYDSLLKETSWMNARKVVEPVCLDFLVKWRGDEETGRDQLDEILREVVVITDSEDEEVSEDEDSPEAMEISSTDSQPPAKLVDHHLNAAGRLQPRNVRDELPSRSPYADDLHLRRAPRKFHRYQAAWEAALKRRQDPHTTSPHYHERAQIQPFVSSPGSSMVVERPLNNDSASRFRSSISHQTNHNIYIANADHRGESFARPEHEYLERSPIHPKANDSARKTIYERPLSFDRSQPRNGTGNYVSTQPLASLAERPTLPGSVLQDMLLPSIEHTSDYPTLSPSHSVSQKPPYQTTNGQQSYVQRDIEYRRQTPHQVIIIDDDSPQRLRSQIYQNGETNRFAPSMNNSDDSSLERFNPELHRSPHTDEQRSQGLLMSTHGSSRVIPGASLAPSHARHPLSFHNTNPSSQRVTQQEHVSGLERRQEPQGLGRYEPPVVPYQYLDDLPLLQRNAGPAQTHRFVEFNQNYQRHERGYDHPDHLQQQVSGAPSFSRQSDFYSGNGDSTETYRQKFARDNTQSQPSMYERNHRQVILHEGPRRVLGTRGNEMLPYDENPDVVATHPDHHLRHGPQRFFEEPSRQVNLTSHLPREDRRQVLTDHDPYGASMSRHEQRQQSSNLRLRDDPPSTRPAAHHSQIIILD